MNPSDDEIIDAEIVEDDDVPSTAVAIPAGSNMEGFGNLTSGDVDLAVNYPPGTVRVPLTFEQRNLIRGALAHYHDNGPRQRNTHFIISTMDHLSGFEPDRPCETCDNTGKYRDMYEMHYCHCPRGIRRRQSGD